MARKQPVEDRDVLKFKLGSLQEYISFRERVLDQLKVDLQKAALSIPRRDLIGFVDRVQHAVNEAYQAFPSGSAFEQDLTEARAQFDDDYLTAPEWAETKSTLIEAGFDAEKIESGFDSTLTHLLEFLNEWMKQLREWVRSTKDWGGLEAVLGEIVAAVDTLLQFALKPANQLRQHYLNLLDGQVSLMKQRAGRSKRRGRKKNPDVARRNEEMFTAWKTNNFNTFIELAKEFGCSPDVARKAITARRRRSGPTSSPARRRSSK
jgi:hypothetical protein